MKPEDKPGSAGKTVKIKIASERKGKGFYTSSKSGSPLGRSLRDPLRAAIAARKMLDGLEGRVEALEKRISDGLDEGSGVRVEILKGGIASLGREIEEELSASSEIDRRQRLQFYQVLAGGSDSKPEV